MKLSAEFFPPRTQEGLDKLVEVAEGFRPFNLDYLSVTYGAGGSTQERTLATVKALRARDWDVAPHLTCVDSERNKITELLKTYMDLGVHRIVALRGDIPSGMRDLGDFNYASDLVAFIRETTGDHFHIEVAAYPEVHPQAKSWQTDMQHFGEKMAAGANAAITQYFFNPDAYCRFVNAARAQQINGPIIPGIMPITNYEQLARFSDACGSEIPRWLRKRLEAFGDDKTGIAELGLEVIGDLCERVIKGGAPGLHFYAMNALEPTRTLMARARNLAP
ncbi:MAG: methylenetetrahydrofolate reductase [NAD(P)H] [Thiotrichales bacterium]|jgi:methylenetetrahydrofolate reductase (NADPH)|nr:methylenetetrahydrofolate reductase [NAD(P)H] [Thiotrichales bacterium]